MLLHVTVFMNTLTKVKKQKVHKFENLWTFCYYNIINKNSLIHILF